MAGLFDVSMLLTLEKLSSYTNLFPGLYTNCFPQGNAGFSSVSLTLGSSQIS